MQTLLVLVFAAGLVLFGMSRFDLNPDEFVKKVNHSVIQQEQEKADDAIRNNSVENVTDNNMTPQVQQTESKEPLVTAQQADTYASMETPVEPPLDLILSDQGDVSSSLDTGNINQNKFPLLAKKTHTNTHTMEDVFQVNSETDEILQHFNSIRNSY